MSIRVNMDKARDIWRDKWRQTRKPLLEELDIEFMRAVEADDRSAQLLIAAKKEELRDVTNTPVGNITEADHLKLVWPECLGDKPENL